MDHNSVILPQVNESLESSLPPGVFSESESSGSKSALRALRIIEKMLTESAIRNALQARYALLQSFPRLSDASGTKGPSPVPQDFVRQYCTALCPDWYAEFLPSLNDDEIEIFLKLYVQSHEAWARPEGVAVVVRTMLENSLHAPVKVRVLPLKGEETLIPENLHSLLGKRAQYSALGRTFLLGRRCVSRPTRFEVHVGPITPVELQAFQRSGWADGAAPGWKLRRLVEFVEPFFMSASLRFLFEARGFVVGKATVGSHRLGVVGGLGEESFGLLVNS